MNHELLQNVAWQFFYSGLMLLLVIFSWLIAALFRNRTFVFYGFLMFFFVPYFLAANNVVYTALGFENYISRVTAVHYSPIGIVVSGYFFIGRFVNLPRKIPILNYIFLTVTIGIIFFINLRIITGKLLWGIVGDILAKIWILLTILIAVLSMRRGIKEGRVLLVSTLTIFLGGTLFIAQITGLVPKNDWGLYGFEVGTILFSWILFYGLIKNIDKIRNESLQAQEIDQLKSRFFANISHEFRTPLTLVIDPIQKVAEKLKEGKNKKLLQDAHQNSLRLLNLVNQILELTKLEVSKMKLYLTKSDIIPLLRNITGTFESMADRRNITLNFTTEIDKLVIWFDREKLHKIMNNLISNAFKFTDPGGTIHVQVQSNGAKLQVSVQDTGCGISEEQLPHIFDRFFRAYPTNNKSGAGIGLALVKELVNLHKGSISVESEVDKGAVFTFQLPKKGTEYQQEDFIRDGNFTNTTIPPMAIYTKIDNDPEQIAQEKTLSGLLKKQGQKLLVIEDNDDVRRYIMESLNKNFNTLEARNGQEGIDLALKESLDLIICDVQMPVKNGYEVVAILKSDMRCSHIPIILLTAKVGKDDKIKGLEMGADDYLPKPFDSDELKARVVNLIKQRRLLQKKFSGSDFFKIKNTALNGIDRKFLGDIEQILSIHYADPQLGVEKLAHETGMSQSSLNRKLNSFLGISASKLIQNYRLQQAKKLLHQKKGTISEVAFLTGFGSPSYFVKCFREKYEKTPGNLLEEEK